MLVPIGVSNTLADTLGVWLRNSNYHSQRINRDPPYDIRLTRPMPHDDDARRHQDVPGYTTCGRSMPDREHFVNFRSSKCTRHIIEYAGVRTD
jgi:hypothetical protein